MTKSLIPRALELLAAYPSYDALPWVVNLAVARALDPTPTNMPDPVPDFVNSLDAIRDYAMPSAWARDVSDFHTDEGLFEVAVWTDNNTGYEASHQLETCAWLIAILKAKQDEK